MNCPNCEGELAVIHTATQTDRVYRRRACTECDARFTSVETLDDIPYPWRKSSKRQKK
jgi:transcriptional regulator NrdR family protein